MEAQGLGSARYRVVPRTLVFVRHGERLLLIRRSADRKVWPGKVNGIGGHVEAGEGFAASAQREVLEESGLHVDNLRLVGLLHVTDSAVDEGVLVVVFTADSTSDDVTASAEGELIWVRPDTALSLDVVPDLRQILPRLRSSDQAGVFVAVSTGTPGGHLTFVEA